MERIASAEQIKEAVMEGAVARLRPKLLTEGTMILALIPMLWSTGVGSEFMKPMAAPNRLASGMTCSLSASPRFTTEPVITARPARL